MPPPSRPKPFGALILLLAALCLLSLILVANLILSLPNQAAERFGEPASWLTMQQRYWYSALLLAQEKDLSLPTQTGGAEQEFTVSEGESVASITGRLWETGLIPSPGAFRTYLLYSGLDTTLKAGKYHFSSGLSPMQIAQAMQSAVSSEVVFTILAGWRAEEIAAALPTSGLSIDPGEFLLAVHSLPADFAISTDVPRESLEGFLFPELYELKRGTPLEDLLAILFNNFESHMTQEMRAGYQKQGLSLYQAVTLASMVSREAVVEDEMPLIASVFYNRLAVGGKLESDPTVQYALGYNEAQGTWWTNPLSAADLQVDSPYNTYVYNGLPPGPIANPGLAALKAVAFPAQTPYYYFRAACDGSGRHLFAETYDEHLGNACP
jgi:UPF0755 protein